LDQSGWRDSGDGPGSAEGNYINWIRDLSRSATDSRYLTDCVVDLQPDRYGSGRSDDAIRSLVISYKLLGTREWFVVHHTDCGMLLFTNDDMRNLLASSLKTAVSACEGHRNAAREAKGAAQLIIDGWPRKRRR
jgi:hypothetical protein